MTAVAEVDQGATEQAARVLSQGGIVALPTDTQYGLAALASNGAAMMKLFHLKRRPDDQALPIFLPDHSWLGRVATDVSPSIRRLAQAVWPGAVTLVLRRNPKWYSLAAPYETVALRIPAHPVARALLDKVGAPLTGTSANRHQEPAATTPEAILELFGSAVEILQPSGLLPAGKPSTILDCTGAEPRVLRSGLVGEEDIRAILAGETDWVQT